MYTVKTRGKDFNSPVRYVNGTIKPVIGEQIIFIL